MLTILMVKSRVNGNENFLKTLHNSGREIYTTFPNWFHVNANIFEIKHMIKL